MRRGAGWAKGRDGPRAMLCGSAPMKPLKIGVSGVRGVVGETLTPELVVAFAQAFGTYLDSGTILVCRDTRPSGPMVSAAVTAGLLAAGCEVIDLGICPTPTMQLAVPWLGANGGISVTAGHNPAPWNALKFARADGLYLNTGQAEELLDVYHQGGFSKAAWDRIRTAVAPRDAIDHHLEQLAGAFDVDAVRSRRLKVAVDCCNGACARLSPRWIESLGCEVLAINDDPAAPFPHDPEPRADVMGQVRAVVKAGRADIGFVHDADGERLAIVDERGRPRSEEVTLALATAIRLGARVGPVVTNISTTGAIDRIAARFGAAVVRTPVGQPYISEAMLECGAVIGGEGNGSVAVPEVQPSHDSAAAIGLLLERLATSPEPVSALADALPQLAMLKQAVPVEPNLVFSALHGFRNRVREDVQDGLQEIDDADVDLRDGVKVVWPDGWVHVRASNTESLIRIITEADTPARAVDLMDWARERLRP
jgi:phosphomannomutase